MAKEKHLMTEADMDKTLKSMAKQIVADNLGEVILVGIRTRGVPLAHWLAKQIGTLTKKAPKVGILDINLYRDDLSEVGDQPIVQKTEIPFNINGLGIILVDDVLYTGRTIRSALDALIDFGRPKFIKLAVLVDRGWRELPIQADYVGKKIATHAEEVIKVMLKESDGKNQVILKENFSNRQTMHIQ
ncbi:MAG: bifunctional pyr operon transcriptional regulator/uracil phosphoribosyltransferase [Deltaproteobacteria bacterium RIFCSPLOWO2_12_FULL_44_12]|nr:MAG: bifunctional pyr operon transcriptional regulator/uracil phosphoribosyltransferase [Deltaproteobacteria bacterium RIFCSPHIGHO2_01_FULL_43_49]OGQ15658.1 MAG: bifunctional pyr operon transcriptional regulator/uracil phosphoribosyltransferase [Deltaproteobacteria bacterium RIFCSPHIGHO2_02_FULL_44_53]OGQ28627.1 MAG: bifunctional pyr operon transcriptional regulator/uracil phosphoribosyltransferase [Deltaproteobacteria bacterium RIFCSPHIGHO2_12_FULL_44_21]OGQ31949.1 MAG: bifunctional pyr oper